MALAGDKVAILVSPLIATEFYAASKINDLHINKESRVVVQSCYLMQTQVTYITQHQLFLVLTLGTNREHSP